MTRTTSLELFLGALALAGSARAACGPSGCPPITSPALGQATDAQTDPRVYYGAPAGTNPPPATIGNGRDATVPGGAPPIRVSGAVPPPGGGAGGSGAGGSDKGGKNSGGGGGGGLGCPASAADGSDSPRDVGGIELWAAAILLARLLRREARLAWREGPLPPSSGGTPAGN